MGMQAPKWMWTFLQRGGYIQTGARGRVNRGQAKRQVFCRSRSISWRESTPPPAARTLSTICRSDRPSSLPLPHSEDFDALGMVNGIFHLQPPGLLFHVTLLHYAAPFPWCHSSKNAPRKSFPFPKFIRHPSALFQSLHLCFIYLMLSHLWSSLLGSFKNHRTVVNPNLIAVFFPTQPAAAVVFHSPLVSLGPLAEVHCLNICGGTSIHVLAHVLAQVAHRSSMHCKSFCTRSSYIAG